MNKKTIGIFAIIAIVAFVISRLIFSPGGNEVVIEITPEEMMMQQQMMQMMDGQMQGMVPMAPNVQQ